MSTLEEVKEMQQNGLGEDQIVKTLQDKGVQYKDISEALAQSKIRAAVEQAPTDPSGASMIQDSNPDTPPGTQIPITPPNSPRTFSNTQEFPEQEAIPGMQQSMLQSPSPLPSQDQTQTQEYAPSMSQSDSQASDQDSYAQYDPYSQEYQQYDQYSAGSVSPDTISEISEQIVSEKFQEMRKLIEKVLDFKTSVEAKTEAIEERLRRMEEIMHALQSSVLRKVGDYITNVDDIKRELIQTQQTFTKLVPELKKHTSHKHKTHKKHSTPKHPHKKK
jgi:hypothetical protein